MVYGGHGLQCGTMRMSTIAFFPAIAVFFTATPIKGGQLDFLLNTDSAPSSEIVDLDSAGCPGEKPPMPWCGQFYL